MLNCLGCFSVRGRIDKSGIVAHINAHIGLKTQYRTHIIYRSPTSLKLQFCSIVCKQLTNTSTIICSPLKQTNNLCKLRAECKQTNGR